MNDFEWRKGYSLDQLVEAIEVYYQVFNLLQAKTRISICTKLSDTVFPAHQAELVIQRAYKHQLERSLRSLEIDNTDYQRSDLDKFIATLPLPRQPKKTGIKRSMTAAEYELFEQFQYYLAMNFKNDNWFHVKDCCVVLAQMLLTKTTLEQGFENPRLGKVAMAIISSASDEFINSGFVFDLFVHDQVAARTSTIKQPAIECYKSHLSTWFVERSKIVTEHVNLFAL